MEPSTKTDSAPPAASVKRDSAPQETPLGVAEGGARSSVPDCSSSSGVYGNGLTINRMFTTPGSDPLDQVKYEKRMSSIKNTDGSVVFEMDGAEVPADWSQVATDIMAIARMTTGDQHSIHPIL